MQQSNADDRAASGAMPGAPVPGQPVPGAPAPGASVPGSPGHPAQWQPAPFPGQAAPEPRPRRAAPLGIAAVSGAGLLLLLGLLPTVLSAPGLVRELGPSSLAGLFFTIAVIRFIVAGVTAVLGAVGVAAGRRAGRADVLAAAGLAVGAFELVTVLVTFLITLSGSLAAL